MKRKPSLKHRLRHRDPLPYGSGCLTCDTIRYLAAFDQAASKDTAEAWQGLSDALAFYKKGS